jgi:hypothetical protein
MKIALIELGGSHDECLYSQIKILKSTEEIHLTLICDNSLKENVKYFDLVDNKVFVELRKGYKRWIDLYKIWQTCKAERFDKIIFNTAQGKTTRQLLRFPFNKQTEFYGILHDTQKVISSRTQRIISKKINHYFLLNEYLEPNIRKVNKSKLSFSVFHPFFFPEYPKLAITKKDNEIWICIPGQVELKRRDYKALFNSIKENGINENVKIVLLGRHGHAHGNGAYIKEQISAISAEDKFMLWENFIPVDIFYSIIKNSDYILPLIHEDDISGDLYKNQISGSFNLAVGYRKPLLIEKMISDKLNHFNPIVYDKVSLMKTINQLTPNNTTNNYSNERWSFNYQKRAYFKSLGIT